MNILKPSALLFLLVASGLSVAAQAKAPWQSNKLREKKKYEKIQEKIDAISLYREKLSGTYDIIGPVSAQDALTNKRTYIYNKMRQIAYEMGADAVMEIRCKKTLNWLAQSCEGFGIKFKGDESGEVLPLPE